MTVLAGGALLLVLVMLQVTWVPHLTLLGADPNPALLAVMGWAWIRGTRAGLVWAVAAGLLLDLTSAGPLGIHAVGLLTAAYCAGLAGSSLHRGRVVVPAAAAAAGSLAYGLVLIGAAEILGQPLPPPAVARVLLLGGALYNAALMPLGLVALEALHRSLPRREAQTW